MRHLFQRQHPGQHGATDAILLVIETDGLVIGCRSLHRQVSAHRFVTGGGVFQQPDIGENDGAHAQVCSSIDGIAGRLPAAIARIGIERQQHPCTGGTRITHTLARAGQIEIQTAEITRIRPIAKTDIDTIGPVVDRRLERYQATRRAHQFHFFLQHCPGFLRIALVRSWSPMQHCRTPVRENELKIF